jgi:hypothetical protein
MSGGRRRGPGRRLPVFWIGFLVVLGARALVAASRLDEFRGEELYQGSLAWALWQDFPLDPARLPVIAHLRGSVVFGALAVPLYAVLGPSYAALKVLAVAWSGLAGGLLAFAVERGLGARGLAVAPCARRRCALGAVALAALFPPAYQMVDAAAFGSHLDSVVPTLAALAVVVARPGPLSARRATLLGLALGCGAFFSLQCVLAAPAVLCAWWGADCGFWRRRASLGALAAALPAAFVPLVSRSSRLVTRSVGEHVLPHGLGGMGAKLAAWLGGDGVRMTLFEDSGGAWAGWVFALAALVAFALLGPRVRRAEPLALFALAHPVLVVAAWAASDFELNFHVRGNGMGSRYLMPILPAVAITLVLGAAALRARGRAGVAGGRALVGAALATGALGFAGLLDPRPSLALPPRLGTNFAFFEKHFARAGGWREQLALARRVDPDWDAYRPLSYAFLAPTFDALGLHQRAPGAAAFRTAAALPAGERPYVLAALGGASVAMLTPERAAEALAALPADFAPDERRWFRLGIGRAVMSRALEHALRGPESQVLSASLALLPSPGDVPADALRDVALGAGFQLGRVFTPYNENLMRALDGARALAPEVRAPLLQGVALGWRLRFREATWTVPAPRAAKIERMLAPADRAAFRAGLALSAGAWD